MKVTLLLADAAQASEGKLYILGGGWSLTGPAPSPMAVAIKVEVPWDRANIPHQWTLDLLDADGKALRVPMGADGAMIPLELRGTFEPGRPSGLRPGTPLDVVLAINFGPLPLPPAGRYEWRFSIDGYEDTWSAGFTTRAAPVDQVQA